MEVKAGQWAELIDSIRSFYQEHIERDLCMYPTCAATYVVRVPPTSDLTPHMQQQTGSKRCIQLHCLTLAATLQIQSTPLATLLTHHTPHNKPSITNNGRHRPQRIKQRRRQPAHATAHSTTPPHHDRKTTHSALETPQSKGFLNALPSLTFAPSHALQPCRAHYAS